MHARLALGRTKGQDTAHIMHPVRIIGPSSTQKLAHKVRVTQVIINDSLLIYSTDVGD